MVEQLTLQTILMFAQTVGVLVAVTYYLTTMRNQNRARQAQVYNNIWNRSTGDSEFLRDRFILSSLNWNTYQEFTALFPWSDRESENTMALFRVGSFLEGLSVLVRENLIDIRLVAMGNSGLVTDLWYKLRPVIEEVREVSSMPAFFAGTEYLYNEISQYMKEHPELEIYRYEAEQQRGYMPE